MRVQGMLRFGWQIAAYCGCDLQGSVPSALNPEPSICVYMRGSPGCCGYQMRVSKPQNPLYLPNNIYIYTHKVTTLNLLL